MAKSTKRRTRKPVVVNPYVRVLRDSRDELLRVQAEAEQRIATEYANLRAKLDPHLDALTAAYGRELTRVQSAHLQAQQEHPDEALSTPVVPSTWLMQQWPALSALIAHSCQAFGSRAHAITRDAMEEAADIGEHGAQAAMRAALLPIAHRLPANVLKHPGG